MRIVVTFEERFIRSSDGNVFTSGMADYQFLCRYLTVFDQVVVLARVKDNEQITENCRQASGPEVRFVALPCYIGPSDFFKNYRTIHSRTMQLVSSKNAFILRVASPIATTLWQKLKRYNLPYGLEVVADPWDALSPGSVKTILRPILRQIMRRHLIRQCSHAQAVAYVTKYSLQKRYPPGNWSTHYSSIALPKDVLVDQTALKKRIERLQAKIISGEPYHIGFIGNLSVLYKAPDILISAVSDCIQSNLNLKLFIVGEGSQKAQLIEQANRLGISNKVHFIGALPPGPPIYSQLDDIDLYVLPSRQEGLPRSMIEAMARGVPCIGASVGGIAELLEPEEIVAPNQVKTLAEKIKSLLTDKRRMQQLAQRNVEIAREYISEVLEKRRIEFYSKVKEITERISKCYKPKFRS